MDLKFRLSIGDCEHHCFSHSWKVARIYLGFKGVFQIHHICELLNALLNTVIQIMFLYTMFQEGITSVTSLNQGLFTFFAYVPYNVLPTRC
jgi:hypothetical protein